MTAFQCIPIPTDPAERFRRTGHDDNGNEVRRIVATPGNGFPCRHCLRLAEPGEVVLLGSYNLPRPRGIYWTPSPIFLHEAACPRAEALDEVAPICVPTRSSPSGPTTRRTSASTTWDRSVRATTWTARSDGLSRTPGQPS